MNKFKILKSIDQSSRDLNCMLGFARIEDAQELLFYYFHQDKVHKNVKQVS